MSDYVGYKTRLLNALTSEVVGLKQIIDFSVEFIDNDSESYENYYMDTVRELRDTTIKYRDTIQRFLNN